jgi:hypothetical protein
MAERRLIFNAKGFQLGYVEGNAVFDLNGRRRCSYTGATGNLGDFDSGKILGHISLDGTFVGASWLSDDLFGKPRGEARPDRLVKVQGAHNRKVQRARSRVERAPTQRPEDLQGTPGSMTPSPAESEMLSRAIGMIRSALVKRES